MAGETKRKPAVARNQGRRAGIKWNCYALKTSVRRFLHARPYWYSDARLMDLRQRYAGEICVIVGNGPSLKQTPTHLLDGHYAFGMNRAYIAFDELGFQPPFYIAVNKLVLQQCWEDIRALPMTKFLSSCNGVRPPSEMDAVFLRTDGVPYTQICFSDNPIAGLWEGHTVTYVAMQLASWMGFSKVLLIGVDHNFVTRGIPNEEVVASGDDPNHFSAAYFGKGFRWQLPDLEASELAYRMAKMAFRRRGAEIVDCTVDGKCPVFRKSTLEQELT